MNNSDRNFNTNASFGQLPADQFDAEYLRLIKAELATALAHRHEMPAVAKRGLTDETIDHFNFGYIPDWINTKSQAELNCGLYVDKKTGEIKKLPPPSERVIIPTASGNHFDAVATKAARANLHKNYWKQHAGEMELFCDPAALEADTILIVEGEWDAASIWQCSGGKIAVVAILGCDNWKKTLLPKLDDLRGKRVVLMLDADTSGKNGGTRLRNELLKRGIPAFCRHLYDVLTPYYRKLYGERVDANDILQARGDKYLNDLIQDDILGDYTVKNLDIVAEEIKQGKYIVKEKPRNTDFSNVSGADVDEIKVMLKNFVHAKDLTRDEWWAVGAIMFRYGFTVDDFKAWSDDGDSRYDENRCKIEWNDYKTAQELQDDDNDGYTIATLIHLAKRHGYNPPNRKPTTKSIIAALNFPDELKNEIEEWEDINGTIDPKIFPKLDAAKKFIESLSALNFKSSFAYVPATRNKVALCKFYLPSIAQKFFDTLKNARSLSREILKKISQETAEMGKSGASIPNVDLAEINRLSEIAPSKIVEEVDIIVTALKRKHKAFVAHQQARQRAEAQKAAVDAYNANPAWTQKKIPDCPINLVLPDSVYFSEKEVGTQTITENGKSITHAATKSPIVPTKIFRTPKSHVTRYEVAIKSRRHWRHIIVDGEELADSRKILRLATDGGAIIKDAKALTNYFADIIAANEDQLPEVTCYTRPGWHDGKFIYPTPDVEDNYRVIRSGIDYDSIFKVQGDKDAWLKMFWNVVHGNQGELKRIVIGACLLAPMLNVIKIPNPQFNLWGTSNYAKTPLPKVGLSVYGDPSEGAMLRTWNATAKNMLTMSAGFNGLPLMVDEGETMSRRTQAELSEYVYNYSIGIIGQANKRNGDVRATEKFRGVRFSTAERPLHDTTDKRGAYKRLIDIHVTKPLFPDDYARNLHIFCEGNYGHFGRQWTRYIEANQDKIRADFDRTEKRLAEDGFTRDGIPANYSSVDATNARAVIGCAVAYWHFLMCLEIEDKFDFVEARDDAAAILAKLPTVDEISDVKHSVQLLASWVVENPRRFITPARVNGVEVDGVDEPANTHASTVGKKFADGRIAFFANAFRNICEECRIPSYEKFLCDLYDADLLDCKSSREKSKMIKVDGQSARAYVLNAGAFAKSDDDD